MRHGVIESVVVVLFAVGFYVGLPVLMFWGWVRWFRRTQPRTLPSILSLIGFTLATASGLLAVSSVLYAHARGGFPYYDPLLMRIYAWGPGEECFRFPASCSASLGSGDRASALACPCMFRGHSPVLVRVGDGGIVFP
jgi:hypothetical protein